MEIIDGYAGMVSERYRELVEDLFGLSELKKLDELPSHTITDVLRMRKRSYKRSMLDHTLSVSKTCYLIGEKLKLNVRELARAGLLHDIGFVVKGCKICEIDPISLYSCGFCHHRSSARIAREIGEKDTVVNAIRSHMFPLCLNPPMSKESIVLWFADKLCALTDFIFLNRIFFRDLEPIKEEILKFRE